MAETKSRSIRVEDSLWEKFCALEGTQNDAFRRLLESAKDEPGLVQKIYERQLTMELKLEEVLETVQSGPPTSSQISSTSHVEPVSTPLTEREPGTFPCRCEHSGCKGAIFKGVRKRETLCPACEDAGHKGDRHDCPECWEPA